MKPGAEPLDVTTEELEALLEGVREPLGETGYQKLKAAIRTLGYVTELLENREATLAALRRLLCQASTEKTAEVLKQAGIEGGEEAQAWVSAPPRPRPQGMGAARLLPIVEPKRSRSPMGRYTRGTGVRSVGAAKSTRCAIPACWCGSKARPQSRPRCTSGRS
jgi:hypothetical protein